MRTSLYLIFIIAALFYSCKSEDSQRIINESINYSGGLKYDNSTIKFNFRNRNYTIHRNDGNWYMKRGFNDSTNYILDTYDPDGFKRTVNNKEISVKDSMQLKYIESINSVFYFALLPYKLNDQAVVKEYLGKESIKENIYHKVKISFNKDGGGVDFEDKFVYWFDVRDKSLDYLAYSFTVNGGGYRFRKAYNERFINQIRFVDYENYNVVDEEDVSLENLGKEFEKSNLKLLSKIELTEVQVN